MRFAAAFLEWSGHPFSLPHCELIVIVSKEIELSFVIPVYNGSKSIAEVVRNIKELTVNLAAEVILVNDGSDDASEETCNELAEELPDFVHFVHLARNFGEQEVGSTTVREDYTFHCVWQLVIIAARPQDAGQTHMILV